MHAAAMHNTHTHSYMHVCAQSHTHTHTYTQNCTNSTHEMKCHGNKMSTLTSVMFISEFPPRV